MSLLDAIRHILWPEIPQVDPALLERELAAERKAANGFKVLKESRESYDRRKASSKPLGLSTIQRNLTEQDRLVREALEGADEQH